MERQAHEYADKFPMLAEPELKELADDIKKNGLLEPIRIYQDKILDGRNRYAACKLAGVTPRLVIFSGTDEEAMAFVVSENLSRRHLNESQRAMIAADFATMKVGRQRQPQEKPERTDTAPVNAEEKPVAEKPKALSSKQAAKMMNVGRDSVQKAKVLKKTAPEKAKEVSDGKKSLNQATIEVKKEAGVIDDESIAKKLGASAVASLKRIDKKYRPLIYGNVKTWIESNIDL
jgi:ParB-like chromosome segregation protein Spo0J